MINAVHPRYVLDASVAVKWFSRHEEPYRDTALALRELHRAARCRLIIPEFGLLEILNAIRYGARAAEGDGLAALEALEELQIESTRLDPSLIRTANIIAWRYNVTLYDAAYVALAEATGSPLVTADDDLVRSARGHGMVLGLKELVIPV